MKYIADKRVDRLVLFLEKAANEWDLEESQKEKQEVANGKRDEHGEEFLLGVDIEIRQIV